MKKRGWLQKGNNKTYTVIGVLLVAVGVFAGLSPFLSALSRDVDAGSGDISFDVVWVNGTSFDGRVRVFSCDADDDVTNSSYWTELEDRLDPDDVATWSVAGDGDTYYIVEVPTADYTYYEVVNRANQTVRVMPFASDPTVITYDDGETYGVKVRLNRTDVGEAGFPYYTDVDLDLNVTSVVGLTLNFTFAEAVAVESEDCECRYSPALLAGNATVTKNQPVSLQFTSNVTATVVVRADVVDEFEFTWVGVAPTSVDVTYAGVTLGAGVW